MIGECGRHPKITTYPRTVTDLKIAKESKMKIQDVLSSKGQDIKTVPPMTTLRQIVHIFVQREISSVVVVSVAGGVIGIVTDRVLLQAMSRHSVAAFDFVAAEVMVTSTPHCSPEDNILHAMRLMTEQRIRHVLVRKGGEMIGLVSIGDLVKAQIRDAELETNVLRDLAGVRRVAS